MAAALEKLPKINDPRVLIGFNTADDAGIVKINDDLAMVQTVDFFTPIVDDPYMYGQISAANSLSDIYAMGGAPFSALNVVGFPKNLFSMDVLAEILHGGFDKAREADTVIVGGHTISDDELKYGLAVTGFVHPDKIISNAGARPGDVIFLTKPIGTGTITTALKAGKCPEALVRKVSLVMAQLNKSAAEVCQRVGVHAATDITGFGLLGHALELAQASHAELLFEFSKIPFFPEALETTIAGFVPGGTRANRLFVAPNVQWDELTDTEQLLLCDPQTSGGLLIFVPERNVPRMEQELGNAGLPVAAIGMVTQKSSGRIIVKK